MTAPDTDDDVHITSEFSTSEDILDRLEHLNRQHELVYRLQVGQVLLQAFFGGDARAYHSRSPTKEARFSQFVRDNEIQLGRLRLGEVVARNCIRARIVFEKLPDAVRSSLFFSQFLELSRVLDANGRDELAVACIQRDWSVRQLMLAVRMHNKDGRVDFAAIEAEAIEAAPASEAEVLEALVAQPGRLVARTVKMVGDFGAMRSALAKVEAGKLSAKQKARLRASLAELRAEVLALEGDLG